MSILRTFTATSRITGNIPGLATATSYSFKTRLDADILHRLVSGDKKIFIVAQNAAGTNYLWAMRLADGGANSATVTVPQVRKVTAQFRVNTTTSEKNANALVNIETLQNLDFIANTGITIHGWVDGTNMRIYFVDEADNIIADSGDVTLSGQTPESDAAPKIIINATVGDDPGMSGAAQATVALGECKVDGLALYAPAVKFATGAAINAVPAVGDTNLQHLYYFEATTGNTVSDKVGAGNLTIGGTEGQDFSWNPKGPSLDFSDNVGPPTLANFEYVTIGGASGIVQNQRYEGHRNGNNANGNLRLQATAGVFDMSKAAYWTSRILLQGDNGYFATARSDSGPSLALRKNGAINDTYMNIGVNYTNTSGDVVVSSVCKANTGESGLGDHVIIGNPNDPGNEFNVDAMFVANPSGADWLISVYFKRVPVGASPVFDNYWRLLYAHPTPYVTDDIDDLMIRLTTQNNATLFAFSGSNFHGHDSINLGGAWFSTSAQTEIDIDTEFNVEQPQVSKDVSFEFEVAGPTVTKLIPFVFEVMDGVVKDIDFEFNVSNVVVKGVPFSFFVGEPPPVVGASLTKIVY